LTALTIQHMKYWRQSGETEQLVISFWINHAKEQNAPIIFPQSNTSGCRDNNLPASAVSSPSSHLGHSHLLRGLLRRPPQLSVAFRQETPVLQVQVRLFTSIRFHYAWHLFFCFPKSLHSASGTGFISRVYKCTYSRKLSYILYRSKVWGHFEMILFFKEKSLFLQWG